MSAIQNAVVRINNSKIASALVILTTVLANLTVIIGIIIFFFQGGERAKQVSYQAWQVIDIANSSKQTGDGGRRDAIKDLITSERGLSNIALGASDLNKIDFRGAVLADAIFDNVSIADSRFQCLPLLWPLGGCHNTNLQSAHFGTDEDISSVSISMTTNNFAEAILDSSLFRNIRFFKNNTFDRAHLVGAYFANMTMQNGNTFKDAHLEYLHLSKVQFGGSLESNDLSADFTGAFLNGATFDGQDLSPDQLPPHFTRVCKTTFNSEVSYRDCPEQANTRRGDGSVK
jgi:uncharacterized protein YjbI with pentapeptide repeats